jgi:hypothetical protein
MGSSLELIGKVRRLQKLAADPSSLSAASGVQPPSDIDWIRYRKSFVEWAEGPVGVELTVAQRTIALVAFDGFDPVELDDEHLAMARRLFGPVDQIPDSARRVLAAVCGARGGKSAILSALYSLWRMLTADLSSVAPGEVAFAVVVAPDKDTAKQVRNFVAGRCEHPGIKSLIVGDPSESIQLRRPDGHLVEFAVRAASRGGSATRGRTYVSAVLDEAAFFRDAASGVVNDQEVFDSVNARVLPGGLVIVASTPYVEAGLLFKFWSENFGNPSTALVAHAPTLLMREGGPEYETIEAQVRVATAVDGENARREYGAEFISVGGGFYFSSELISRSVKDIAPIVARPNLAAIRVGCGGDLGLVRDSAALVIVHEVDGKITVAEIVERRPAKGSPLRLSQVVADFAEAMGRHRVKTARVDHHAIEPAREHAAEHSINLEPAPGGNTGNEETFTVAREALHSGVVSIPREYQLVADQLREIIAEPLPGGGVSFVSPRKGGRHGDVARALILALWDLEQGQIDITPSIDVNRRLSANKAMQSRWGAGAMTPRFMGGGLGMFSSMPQSSLPRHVAPVSTPPAPTTIQEPPLSVGAGAYRVVGPGSISRTVNRQRVLVPAGAVLNLTADEARSYGAAVTPIQ